MNDHLKKRTLVMATPMTSMVEPLAVPVREGCRISGLSRTELYRRAGAGELIMLKAGQRTLVKLASLKRLVASLPRATIRVAPRAAKTRN
jgi:hypothetical protein